jgi:hypothetical protein
MAASEDFMADADFTKFVIEIRLNSQVGGKDDVTILLS